ncbi:DUF4105 domain-containing protein [Flavobacterium sp. ZT3R17]|uniref:lipoprotein N-acyltransferase Lnb domain-containing protein n=1 Tax=Flavobacterium cryoconiti TaxID=3398736 RepID=UPI003A8B4267
MSVLTCGTGNESYSLFGHTAIRINDPYNNIDVVYNYGAFDFNTPNFVLKFIKGDLQYFAVAHSYADFINEYNYEKRSVYEQELNIPENLKQKLFDNLNTSLASGDSHYTYKFIDKNCTSMVVDIINKTLDTVAIVKNADTDITYRTILYPYFDNHFYEKLGTSIIFGKKVDGLGTQIFLPFELQKSLKKVSFQNHPLAPENKTIIEFDEEIPGSWWNNWYTYVILLGFITLINKKSINLFYLTMMALLGLFFVFVGFYSYHLELGYNYNILLFNPTLLGLLYFYATKNKKGIYNLAIFNIFSLLIYLVILVNKAHLLIVLPLVITSMIILVKLAIQNKKRIPIII